MRLSRSFAHQLNKGFTLIETIVGIVVLAVSFSILTTLIYPLSEQSADQLHQIKAAELAQSVLNEIQHKAFDENSDMAGGRVRCGEVGAASCSTVLAAETGEIRATYNDVDDYNSLPVGEIKDSLGQTLNLYTGYSMSITVCNDANYDGSCTGDTSTAKLIIVTITTPTGFVLNFSTYRANF